ncbi:MAG TPA: hypothetical protein VH744_11310, partial [Terriglobales bacterium]
VSWTSMLTDGGRRGWRGFNRMPGEKEDAHPDIFERLDRIAKILAGEVRSEGLDLISRGGTIQILSGK